MKIDVTEIDLIQLIKEVYRLSIPAGLGFLHFERGGLTDKEANEILNVWKNDKKWALDMDYIRGRACKMTIFREGKGLYIKFPWHDHTDMQSNELLKAIWPKDKPFPELKAEEHGIACNCAHCQIKRKDHHENK